MRFQCFLLSKKQLESNRFHERWRIRIRTRMNVYESEYAPRRTWYFSTENCERHGNTCLLCYSWSVLRVWVSVMYALMVFLCSPFLVVFYIDVILWIFEDCVSNNGSRIRGFNLFLGPSIYSLVLTESCVPLLNSSLWFMWLVFCDLL